MSALPREIRKALEHVRCAKAHIRTAQGLPNLTPAQVGVLSHLRRLTGDLELAATQAWTETELGEEQPQ